jgi:hypothetical protein
MVDTSLEVLFAMPGVGPLIGLVLVPKWCYESIVRDAARSGRSAGSIVLWALLWPVAIAVPLVLVTVALVLVAEAALESPVATVAFATIALTWLIVPGVAGVFVAQGARGLGGFFVGSAGLLAGGALVGIGVWVFIVLTSGGPVTALVAIPLTAFVVWIMAVTQFAVGVLAASLVGGYRDQQGDAIRDRQSPG